MDKSSEADILKQIKAYVVEEDFKSALEVINSIEVTKIKNAPTLCLIGEVYIKEDKYEEAEDVILKAYDKSPSNRRILNLLTTLYIDMGEYAEAEYYYKEFIGVASRDLNRYILRYRIDKGKGERLSVLIDTLERLKDYEYIEEWAYELASLYEAAGETKKCTTECEEIVLWFGHGEYVDKAIALKCKITGEPLPEVSTVEKEKEKELEAQKIAEIKAAAKIRTAEQEAKMKADKEAQEGKVNAGEEVIEAESETDGKTYETEEQIEAEAHEVAEQIEVVTEMQYDNHEDDFFMEDDIDLSMIAKALEEDATVKEEPAWEEYPEDDNDEDDGMIDELLLKQEMSQTLNTLFGKLQHSEPSREAVKEAEEEPAEAIEKSEEESAEVAAETDEEPVEAATDDDTDFFADEVIEDMPSEDKDFFADEDLFQDETTDDFSEESFFESFSDEMQESEASAEVTDEGEDEGEDEDEDGDEDEGIWDIEDEVQEELPPISDVDKSFLADLFEDEAEEDDFEDEVTDSVTIPDTVKDIFATVPNILDVKQQLAETFTKFEDTGMEDYDILAPYDINFVVVGSDKSVKSQIAIGIAKALNTYGICDKTKIVRASAIDLNNKDFSVIFSKIKGGCLIIESADELSDSSVEIIKKEVSKDNQDVAIVLESFEEDILKLWKKYPDLRAQFLNVINVAKYNEMELVTLAKGYIEKRGYEMAKETALALRDYFEKQTQADIVINYEDITSMVDQAIVNLDQRNMKNLFMTVLDNKYEEADMVRLLPQDFSHVV